jgi:Transposase DDE domain group 1
VNAKIRRRLAARKQRLERRIDKHNCQGCEAPMMRPSNIQYELAQRTQGLAYGGLGAMRLLVQKLGLAEAIDERLHLLKIHLPYHESDHVLNLAFNALCDGDCLEDLELRRNDEVYLDALGARRIPDPTTAGDFCRRFEPQHVRALLEVYHAARLKAWARQPAEFFEEARVDMDGVLVPTGGECKAGMDIAYNGVWGYHPLAVTLANTGEVLSIVNRSGNRPSHEGAADEVDRVLEVCFAGGFGKVLLRGDTDFTQTKHLDRWTDDPRVRFIFGMDSRANLEILADDLPDKAWQTLERPPRYAVKTQPRGRPQNVKQQIVRERGFKSLRLVGEEVAEFDYRPTACRKTYRLVVVKKWIDESSGQSVLFRSYRYFFYLTNDRELSAAEVVFEANDRCDQENLNAQLKGAVRALHAPVDNLVSNWAYMVMVSLAWNLKAWWALFLPEVRGKQAESCREEKRQVLRMEFKTFRNALVRLPCQIVRSGRRLIYRLISWNPWQCVLFRWLTCMRC